MSDEELQAKLLAEVPAPQGGYWDQVDDLLNLRDEPRAGELRAAPDTNFATDITAATDSGQSDPFDKAEPRGSLRRRLRWPAAAAAAALLVFAGWFVGTREPSNSTPIDVAAQPGKLADDPDATEGGGGAGPRANRDHWNAIYAVWDCTADDGAGTWLPAFTSTRDDHGIHSHGDGLISIHPFSEVSAGENAQFALFAESMGIEVTAEAITLDDGRRLEAGMSCDGKPAAVQLLRWQFDFIPKDDLQPPTIVTSDFNDERFMNDREVWVVALAPLDADVPAIPAERYEALDRRTQPGNPMDRAGDLPTRRLTPPTADVFLPTAAGLGDSPLAHQLLVIRQEQNRAGALIEYQPPDPETVSHVASVQTERRTVDVFRIDWDTQPYCVDIFSSAVQDPGSMRTCASNDTEPHLQVVDGPWLTSAAAIAAPDTARWLVIELDDGRRLVTDVVDGIAYAEWPKIVANPVVITLLDRDMELLFTFEDFS